MTDDYREIAREMAENRYANLVHAANRGVRCREALEVARKALCFVRESIEDIGANTDDMTARKVCLDTHQVIAKALSDINDPPAKPKQSLPGEDSPEIYRCPACVAIRAKFVAKPMTEPLDTTGGTHGKVTLVPNAELADMLIGAFRYAIGRATYITESTGEWLMRYWNVLPPHYQALIHRDIDLRIANGTAGMKCDIAEWQKVLKLPVKARSK